MTEPPRRGSVLPYASLYHTLLRACVNESVQMLGRPISSSAWTFCEHIAVYFGRRPVPVW